MENTSKKPRLIELIKNKNFSAVFTGGLISDIGSNFVFIAIMFLAISMTSSLTIEKSAQAVALIMVVQIIPSLIIGPFAGVVVDRFDRKKIMIAADIIGASTSFMVLFATSINHLYIFAFFSSFARLFFYPARGASIPRIVDPEQLVQANGLTQTMTQLSALIGPALAGIVVYNYGYDLAFIIDGVSYLISAILIFTINTDLKPLSKGEASVKQLGRDMKEGLMLIMNDKIISYILILFFILLLGIGMINPLLAFYLKSSFGLSEKDFGYIISFSAISGFIGAILITVKGQIKRKLTMITTSTFIVAISMSILGYAPNSSNPVLLLYLAMALIGIINISINIPLGALFQAIIEDKNMGKINAFMGTALSLAQVSGAALATYLVGYMAISNVFTFVGIFTAIVGTFGMIIMKVKNLENIAQEREAENINRKHRETNNELKEIEHD